MKPKFVSKRIEEWLVFSTSAWQAAGRPAGLSPASITVTPIDYDDACYEYLERRFFDLWLSVFERVKPEGGLLIQSESVDFQKAWRENFQWATVWKQLLPLFVYGAATGVRTDILVELASHYCIGQAIPSVIIDRMLDQDDQSTHSSLSAFCLTCYAKGLSGIRSLQVPCAVALENSFVEHTRGMYDSMLTESAQRYSLPSQALSDAIGAYFSEKSRLLSSVFFGILPSWAFTLADRQVDNVKESLTSLRIVRQLNDELSDVYEDIKAGLVTLPWLYAIEQAPDLRSLIEALWQHPESEHHISACRMRLKQTDGMRRAWEKSLSYLVKSMEITRASFSPTSSFELTLIHNLRWAHLSRIEKGDFEDTPTPRVPASPECLILDKEFLVTPVAGAGVLTPHSDGRVLMSLVLKRGMMRWELPAGVAKTGETMEQTAQREAFEETGIKVDILNNLALCWHHSRSLGKGWMGVFFLARPVDIQPSDQVLFLKSSAFEIRKASPSRNPEQYEWVDMRTIDLEAVRRRFLSPRLNPTAHENIIASGFVDWSRIPEQRIHPLHRILLNSYRQKQPISILAADADLDFNYYAEETPIYLQ